MVLSFANELTPLLKDPNDLGIVDEDTAGASPQPLSSAGKQLVHSIFIAISNTTFRLQNVEFSLIVISGALVHSSEVVFKDNAAKSIISSNLGTVVVTAATFRENRWISEEIISSRKGLLDISHAVFENNAAKFVILSKVGSTVMLTSTKLKENDTTESII